MGRHLFAKSISSYPDYRRRLGRLADLWGVDPMLDSPEAEDLLDAIAAYMVDGGDLIGDDAEPASTEAEAPARREH